MTTGNNGRHGTRLVHTLDQISTLMTRQDDLAILRRFDDVHLFNLLMLQSDIDRLLQDFKECAPSVTDGNAVMGQTPWYVLPSVDMSNFEGPADSKPTEALHKKRLGIWTTLKSKLREYDDAILDFAKLRSLEAPSGEDVAKLRRELHARKVDETAGSLVSQSWEAENDDDFVTIRVAGEKGSRVSNWIRLAVGLLKWEFVDRHKALTTSSGPRDIVVGKKKAPISRKEMAQKHAFTSRFAMALFGGIALIVPTVIMSKVEGIDTSLITTSVAVLVFGLVLAFGATDSTGKDVLTATAAYTAVLVVFVGTSLAGKDQNPAATAAATAAERRC
ncbi:hypothetical protein Micbo1qcDRAFT_237478 [Microdochium bolleyi]|uniref:DUF6594 domain-containing protein n=1 Tax=Microdochium bolleyi TaxID=196109 RepID=A0A136IKH5_9PEZI|nr:hypothetical protein Micbo1qcDRAFT_237478 [Microdochium bolleyi]